MSTTVTLKQLFFDTMTLIGIDPKETIFNPIDEYSLNEQFENNTYTTNLDDQFTDVMCWNGDRVFISCDETSEWGNRVYITSALRNPPGVKDLLKEIHAELEELQGLSDSDMRDGDEARDVARQLMKDIQPFIKG